MNEPVHHMITEDYITISLSVYVVSLLFVMSATWTVAWFVFRHTGRAKRLQAQLDAMKGTD